MGWWPVRALNECATDGLCTKNAEEVFIGLFVTEESWLDKYTSLFSEVMLIWVLHTHAFAGVFALPHISDGHSKQVRILIDAGSDKEATVRAAIDCQPGGACVVFPYQILCCALEVIEAVLFTSEHTAFMP